MLIGRQVQGLASFFCRTIARPPARCPRQESFALLPYRFKPAVFSGVLSGVTREPLALFFVLLAGPASVIMHRVAFISGSAVEPKLGAGEGRRLR